MIRPGEGLDSAQIARFGADLADTLGAPLREGALLALAVSGGPDSMAMLALAAAAFPGRVHAATVDHGLRPAAQGEAAMVAGWCAQARVPHRILTLSATIGPSAVQATARALRYDALGRWVMEIGADALATAHHVEDQAETFLMRAVRGSGPAGLAGVRARRSPVRVGPVAGGDAADFLIVRPLLGWRRATLRDIVERAHIPFVDDPSNINRRYERVRVRQLLSETPWLDPAGLARTADYAAEAQAALEEVGDWLWRERLVRDDADGVSFDLADLPRALQRLLVRRAVLYVRDRMRVAHPAFGQASNIEPLLESLRTGGTATQGGVMASSVSAVWEFRPEPPRRSSRSTIPL
jgi:tRNA(Ile)-lysidine synthase